MRDSGPVRGSGPNIGPKITGFEKHFHNLLFAKLEGSCLKLDVLTITLGLNGMMPKSPPDGEENTHLYSPTHMHTRFSTHEHHI